MWGEVRWGFTKTFFMDLCMGVLYKLPQCIFLMYMASTPVFIKTTYIWLLNKPYENEVILSALKPRLRLEWPKQQNFS